MTYDNTNRGVLFKEKEKKSDKHPDYKGKLDIDGVTRYLSGWIKQDKNGNSFLSLSLSAPKDEDVKPAETGGGFVEDDIPFAQAELNY